MTDIFAQLCHKYLVIPEEFPPTNQYSVVHHGSSMRDVLNRFISKVVQLTGNSYDKSRNLLSLGYRSKVGVILLTLKCDVTACTSAGIRS